MEKRKCKAKSFWEFKINRLLDSKSSNSRFDSVIDKIRLPKSKRSNSYFDSAIKYNIFSKSKHSTSPLKQGYYNKITPCSKGSNSRPDLVIEKDNFLRSKRSQTTIFIILAVLIVAVIILFFYLKGGLNFGETIHPDVQPIYSYVENCIEETGKYAVISIGETGGYFYTPSPSTETAVSYYILNGDDLMPSKEKIEEELSFYMNYMLFLCINDFEDFPDFEIEESEIDTKTEIKDDKVVFDVVYPLSIRKGDKTYSIKKFNGEVVVRLGMIYDMDYSMVQDRLKSDGICINCIYDLAVKRDLYVEINDYDEETVMFTIRDEKYQIDEKDYRFYFAYKYGDENE